MNEKQIQETVIRLADLKLELSSRLEAAHNMLRKYVTSKEYSIQDRFEVWTEWCEKKDYDCMNLKIPLFQKMVSVGKPFAFHRHEKFDWLFFLEVFSDDDSIAAKYREQFGVTSDDVKELIIKHNFGTFRMDW